MWELSIFTCSYIWNSFIWNTDCPLIGGNISLHTFCNSSGSWNTVTLTSSRNSYIYFKSFSCYFKQLGIWSQYKVQKKNSEKASKWNSSVSVLMNVSQLQIVNIVEEKNTQFLEWFSIDFSRSNLVCIWDAHAYSLLQKKESICLGYRY